MRSVSTKWVLAGVLLVALILAGVVSYYASGSPDGLERVSEDKGFADTATEHHTSGGPFADYSVKDIGNDRLAGGLAGVAGVVIVLALGSGLVYVVRRRTPSDADGEAESREHEPVA